jgi:coenzyme PQQ synthesis protein D (PqqD)
MKTLSELAFSSEGFAFNPSTGQSYTINTTGRIVIDLLATGLQVGQIARNLAKHFDISFEDAFADVLEFRSQLRIYQLED